MVRATKQVFVRNAHVLFSGFVLKPVIAAVV